MRDDDPVFLSIARYSFPGSNYLDRNRGADEAPARNPRDGAVSSTRAGTFTADDLRFANREKYYRAPRSVERLVHGKIDKGALGKIRVMSY